MRRRRKPEKIRHHVLTCDDQRRFDERRYRTRDGLIVETRISSDRYGHAGYGGTWVKELDELCPGLCDALAEDYELPVREQRVHVRGEGGKPHVTTPNLLELLDGTQYARIPKREIARMVTRWDTIEDDTAEHYDESLRSCLTCTVSVFFQSRGCLSVLVRRELYGIFDPKDALLKTFERATIDEARVELGMALPRTRLEA